MRFFVFISSLLVLFFSCKNRETPKSALYPDYRVWGDEETGMVTVKMQYRLGGPEGKAIAVDPPVKVEFDGREVRADSAKMNGAYYEIEREAADFGGIHHIVYTSPGYTPVDEPFEFSVFSLKNDPATVINREGIKLELEGLKPTDHITLLLNDTTFFGRGIDRIDTIKNGRLVISKEDLDVLSDGPIRMELYREEQRPLRDGGSLWMSYGLRREFELRTDTAGSTSVPGKQALPD